MGGSRGAAAPLPPSKKENRGQLRFFGQQGKFGQISFNMIKNIKQTCFMSSYDKNHL